MKQISLLFTLSMLISSAMADTIVAFCEDDNEATFEITHFGGDSYELTRAFPDGYVEESVCDAPEGNPKELVYRCEEFTVTTYLKEETGHVIATEDIGLDDGMSYPYCIFE